MKPAWIIVAALAGGLADMLAAPRFIPLWMLLAPFLIGGIMLGVMLSSFRAGRRRSSAFVVMRGRVKCPTCEYMLDLDDRHCAQCGTAIVQIKKRLPCEKCRARNWEDDHFCRQCGVALPGAPDAPQADPQPT